MRKLSAFSLLALVVVAAGSALAQTKTSVGHQRYQLAREVLIKGYITQLVNNPRGMPFLGTYLFLQTSNATVPVQLGFFGLLAGHLSVGDSVTVIGMPTADASDAVLLARLVTRGNEIITIRNRNGIALRGR